MKTIARLFPLLLVASLYAQPADPGGWTKIKWGMTFAQVRALYPAAVESRDSYWSHLTLPDISVSGVPFRVSVLAKTPASPIAAVSLTCSFGLRADPQWASCNGPEDFDTLKALLLEKYGRQKNEEHKVEFGDPAHLFLWVFPTTSIQLEIRQTARVPSLGSLSIEYRPIDPQAAGAL